MITRDEQVQKFPVGTKLKHKNGETIYTVLAFACKNYFISWTLEDGNEESGSISAWCVNKFYEEYKEPRKISGWIPVVKTDHCLYFPEVIFSTRMMALAYRTRHKTNKVIDAVEITYEEKS